MTSPTTQASDPEERLCAEFRERAPGADGEMVAAMQPKLREVVRYRWPSLWPELGDLQQAALLRLFELRAEKKTTAKVRPTLKELAIALIVPIAKRFQRRGRDVPIGGWDSAQEGSSESAVQLRELLHLVSCLPKRHSQVLLAHFAHEAGDGPPITEALSLVERYARRRLVAAQEMLFQRFTELESETR